MASSQGKAVRAKNPSGTKAHPQTSKDKANKYPRGLSVIAQFLILVALPLICYWPSFRAEFHLDDWPVIIQNPYVQLKDLKPASLYHAARQDGANNRPLVNLSLALNYYFNQQSVTGYHLVNFLVLVFTVVGIWLTLRKLLGRLGHDSFRTGLAAFLAALAWAVHPVNIQAITYVVQRYASLAGMFSVWSIYFFHLGAERETRRYPYYLASGLFCLFAILSKETAATLPALIFLYKLCFFDEFKPGWVRRNWGWIAGLGALLVLALVFALRPTMLQKIATDFKSQPFTPAQRLITEPRVMLWYLFLILSPFPQYLSVLHDFAISTSLFSPFTTIISILIILAALGLSIYRARNWRIYSFSVFWYLGMLAIEALPLPIDLVHEHRLYLASLSVIAPAFAWPVLRSRDWKWPVALLSLIVLFFAGFTWQRNHTWQNEASLWKDILYKAPATNRPWRYNCAIESRNGSYRAAVPICIRALELDPHDNTAHYYLGASYYNFGEIGSAEKEFSAALETSPEDYLAHNGLGLCYLSSGRAEQAAEEFLKATQIDSRDPLARRNLGFAYLRAGNWAAAEAEIQKAAQLSDSPRTEFIADSLSLLADKFISREKCREIAKQAEQATKPDSIFQSLKQYCP